VASPSSILGQTDDHEARGGRLLLRLGQPCGLATPPSATRPAFVLLACALACFKRALAGHNERHAVV
jgi:hypothetical protein